MSKLNKFLIIFILTFTLLSSMCFAADITNLNATSSDDSISEDLPAAEERVNSDSDTSTNEAIEQNDLLNGIVNSGADEISSEDTTSTPKISSISQATSVPEANLRLSNILSMILISIGIVLIFLAIAILIKLKQ